MQLPFVHCIRKLEKHADVEVPEKGFAFCQDIADVVHLAQAAKEQEKQMSALHPSQPSRSYT